MARRLFGDPGGIEIFPSRCSPALSAECDPTRPAGIFASHQDPDIISSLALWLEFKPDLKCYMSWLRQSFLPHRRPGKHVCRHPDSGMPIRLGALELQAIPAHYLHSSGNSPSLRPESEDSLFGGRGGSPAAG